MGNTENCRSMVFCIEEGCVMQLTRLPGTSGCECSIDITSAVAGLKGLSLLTVKLAECIRLSPEEVVCRLATALFAPDDPQRITAENT